MTLEEIGRRAVAITEARSEYLARGTCERRYRGSGTADDPDEGPCWIEIEDDRESWCGGCKRREELLAARRTAARELSAAINTYRRAERRKAKP